MAAREILIVDDYPQLVKFLMERLASEGYSVRSAATGAECMAAIRGGFEGVVLLDVRLPDSGGLDLFAEIKAINPNLPVIIITAYATIDMAVEAVRQGAFDFIAKGSDLLKRLEVSVKNAFDRLTMSQQLVTLKTQLSGRFQFDQFLTVNPRMLDILKTVQAVTSSNISVLIEGESGTGKELVARAIHVNSPRKEGPFVAVNCAGIPETLLESEMFGYEKGAFTGANVRRIGRFEAADGGTLFLDEVGELPKSLQAKLLRVLQEHAFERIGGNESVRVDIRLVSATNRDLMAEVQKGQFREDLFYRLSAFPVRLLPLRDRPEDIPLLARAFLNRFAREEGKDIEGFTPEAMAMLQAHSFPGNARELENLVRHALILVRGQEVTATDVATTLGSHRVVRSVPMQEGKGPQMPVFTSSMSLDERLVHAFPNESSLKAMQDLEDAYVRRVWKQCQPNNSKAARILGLGRATWYRKLKSANPSAEDASSVKADE